MAKVKCKICGDILKSMHRHDFVVCSCWDAAKGKGVAADGGNDYLKICGNPDEYEVILEESDNE